MILDTLFIESLSNFVHGLSTAFFLYFGINLVFFRATNRPLFILGCLFCLWGVQDLKDLLLYIDTIGDSPYYSTILLSIDMWAVPLVRFSCWRYCPPDSPLSVEPFCLNYHWFYLPSFI